MQVSAGDVAGATVIDVVEFSGKLTFPLDA